MELTRERLLEVLSYDPDTGVFIRKISIKGNRAGSVAGCLDTHGYVVIKVDGRLYKAHRLAFLAMTGEFPDSDVDHRNLARSDNRWENLRAVSRLQNNVNIKSRRRSASQYLGVSWSKSHKAWVARARIASKRPLLGYFKSEREAAIAYHNAVKEAHGEHARGNPAATISAATTPFR